MKKSYPRCYEHLGYFNFDDMKNNSKVLESESICTALVNFILPVGPVDLAQEIRSTQGLEISPDEVRSQLNNLVLAGEIFEQHGRYARIAIDTALGLSQEYGASLSSAEQQEYDWLRTTLQATFSVKGLMLSRIKNKRLYREEYETFADFCRTELDCSLRMANRYILAAEIYCQIRDSQSQNGTHGSQNGARHQHMLPTAERQLRPLAKYDREMRIRYWQLAIIENDGKVPTEKIVQQVINENNIEQDATPHRLKTNQIAKITAQYNPKLKQSNNCWAKIVSLEKTSYTILTWNAVYQGVQERDLIRTEDVNKVGDDLPTRLNRVRFAIEDSGNCYPDCMKLLAEIATNTEPNLNSFLEYLLKNIENYEF